MIARSLRQAILPCGYQVCMWCWHRIKESESGLCPACRTPYGDDPHEFSAVDMEDVVKANKEKVIAEKREKERLRAMREQEKREQLANYATPHSTVHHHHHSVGGGGSSASGNAVGGGGAANFVGAFAGHGGGLGSSSSSIGQFDGADLVAALGSAASSSSSLGHQGSKGPPEPPKDRSVLATMRVIRRNLVYAVGMPPNIATEETLRKPEYFGQYGKVSKIIINRNQNPGDPRRASASAYVTFAHKEDALACILALDGFYHDGRNIRASYGTSKYCSAFIKNVRCNNPDCTYLHHMGDAEDTFSKQEIQAGYVTSGRDVLARQQQIMAQQAAAAFGNGQAGSRKKVGGGGPSGTGKASNGPIFPPPAFDEPLPRKARAQSSILQSKPTPLGGISAPSAASIVAGISNATNAAPPAPHTTLTALTSLKRTGNMPLAGRVVSAGALAIAAKPSQPFVGVISDLTPAESLALQEQRQAQQILQAQKTAKQKHLQQMAQMSSISQQNSPSHSSIGSGTPPVDIAGGPSNGVVSGSSLHMGFPLIGNSFSGNLEGNKIGEPNAINSITSLEFGGSGILGGKPLASSPGVIGGASLAPSDNPFGLGLLSAESTSGGADKWRAAVNGQRNTFGGNGALWDGDSEFFSRPAPIGPSSRNNSAIGAPGGDVGGMSLFGTNRNAYLNGGSSALASILGIELPTGSGTLRDNSAAFLGGTTIQAPVGAVGATVGGLNSAGNGNVGAIGANKPNNCILQPIGAQNASFQGGGVPIGGYSSEGGNHDMALLQSLLPGVNITSGSSYRPAAPQHHLYQQPVGVGGLNHAQWSNGKNTTGTLQQQHDQRQQQQRSGNIW
ncbi:LOW QUALITY PROTEIN: hypothetical protein ACHAXA_005509 [Cyclostephanos tholiformis]|uniref:RRM domain-containing protein n=1 Tax=Cyclostephanos tholiformis TaxID=382380 RepID=A0ABD3RVE4_9STRA